MFVSILVTQITHLSYVCYMEIERDLCGMLGEPVQWWTMDQSDSIRS